MAKAVLGYFVLNDGTNEARCKLCVQPTYSKYTRVPKTNLLSHFNTKHSKATSEEKSKALGVVSLSSSLAPFKDQGTVTDAVVDAVVEGNLPITVVEQPWFRKFMKKSCPKWEPCTKKTVRAKLIKKGQPYQFNFKEYKSKYGKPSTTVDIWTSRARKAFMAVSLHIMKPELLTAIMRAKYN